MLDDRNTVAPDPVPAPLIWSYDDNLTGDACGGDDVSPYAAPARAADIGGLPPTYLMVGDMDIFRDEDIEYAARLTRAGVPVEFHLIPGAPHGFDFLAPDSDQPPGVRRRDPRTAHALRSACPPGGWRGRWPAWPITTW